MINDDILLFAEMRRLAMKAALYFAKNEARFGRFDHTFPVEGMKVRITIEKAVSRDDTKPVFGVDEDERIAD